MKLIKTLLLLVMLLNLNAFAYDARLNSYPDAKSYYDNAIKGDATAAFNLGYVYQTKLEDSSKAIEWYKKAYGMGDEEVSSDTASNLGRLYKDLKQYKKAEIWYKKSIAKGNLKAAYNLAYMYDESLHLPKQAITLYKKAYKMGQIGAANSIGMTYELKLKNYPKAIEWYKKAFKQGDNSAGNNLGYLYQYTLKNMKNAKLWYKKAIQSNNSKSIVNLANLDYHQGNKLLATAYILSLINNGHTKQQVLKYIKNKFKITDKATIKKAYQLQKTLDIPKHYYDRELEEANSTSHTRYRGRR